MVMWSIKKWEVGPVNPIITEANTRAVLIDKDSGELKEEIFLVPYDAGKMDVQGALQVVQDEGYEPNDFGLPP